MSADARNPAVTRGSARTRRRPPPIVVLALAAPLVDDRTYNDWTDFFALLPLSADPDPDAAPAAGG